MLIKLHPKLFVRYYEPYQILKKIGVVAYRLQLPKEARIDLIFYVSQLKKVIKNHTTKTSLPGAL